MHRLQAVESLEPLKKAATSLVSSVESNPCELIPTAPPSTAQLERSLGPAVLSFRPPPGVPGAAAVRHNPAAAACSVLGPPRSCVFRDK